MPITVGPTPDGEWVRRPPCANSPTTANGAERPLRPVRFGPYGTKAMSQTRIKPLPSPWAVPWQPTLTRYNCPTSS